MSLSIEKSNSRRFVYRRNVIFKISILYIVFLFLYENMHCLSNSISSSSSSSSSSLASSSSSLASKSTLDRNTNIDKIKRKKTTKIKKNKKKEKENVIEIENERNAGILLSEKSRKSINKAFHRTNRVVKSQLKRHIKKIPDTSFLKRSTVGLFKKLQQKIPLEATLDATMQTLRPKSSKFGQMKRNFVKSKAFYILTEDPIFQIASSIVIMNLIGKLNFADKKTHGFAPKIFALFMVSKAIIYTYIRLCVWQDNDETPVEIPSAIGAFVKQMIQQQSEKNPAGNMSITGDVVGGLAEKLGVSKTTVREYDLKLVNGIQKQQFIMMFVMMFFYKKLGYAKPLVIQAVTGFMNLLKDPLVQVYILEASATGKLARPFQKANKKVSDNKDDIEKKGEGEGEGKETTKMKTENNNNNSKKEEEENDETKNSASEEILVEEEDLEKDEELITTDDNFINNETNPTTNLDLNSSSNNLKHEKEKVLLK